MTQLSDSESFRYLRRIAAVIGMSVLLGACGGGGGGDDTAVQTTVISGKVLSSSIGVNTNKPAVQTMKAMSQAPKMKPVYGGGYQVLNKPVISDAVVDVPSFAAGDVISSANVYLYNADHPEWLSPVSETTTDDQGNYSFTKLMNAANNGSAYTDGDPIPVGTYTMLIYKPSTFDPVAGVTTDPVVAVQPAFSATQGTVSVDDVEAEPSDVTPRVVTMFGMEKNTDGTYTWGPASMPTNADIQIGFDMAMSRGSIQNITVKQNSATVDGNWALSADWLTATFEPAATLVAGDYNISVPSTVTNVYGNALGYDATGTMTATAVDSTAPTVTVMSPTNNSTNVATSTPVRISSDELLDINSLRLDSTPSVGDRPGVLYVGESGGAYVYEFDLSEPLQLSASYTMLISGLKDLAGNGATELTTNFTTESPSNADGVDSTAGTETQTAQAKVAEVFAKWMRAFNEYNLTQVQALMAAGFVFEYNINENGFMEEDINRNGRLSVKEFTSLLEMAFNQWKYCGNALTGEVVGNVNIVDANNANLQFVFNSSSTNTSQECAESTPDDDFYASVKLVNGDWKISRLSEGFDHRGTELVSHELIEVTLKDGAGATVTNGDTLSAVPSDQDPLTLSWSHVTGVGSYLFMVANNRDPSELGFAMVVNKTSIDDDSDPSADLTFTIPDVTGNNDGLPQGAIDVSDQFGFESDRNWGIENPGEEFIWEVIGLRTLKTSNFSGTTSSVSEAELIRDIAAVSAVKRFKNPGARKDLDMTLYSGNAALGTPLIYSEMYEGYDVGSASQVTIVLNTPNTNAGSMGWYDLSSDSGWDGGQITFDQNGQATITLDLYQGWNRIELSDGVDLYRFFQVSTSGGILPVVNFGQIKDQVGTVVDMDAWNYGQSTTATSLTFTAQVDINNPSIASAVMIEVDVNVYNDSGAYFNEKAGQGSVLTYTAGTGLVDVQNMPIFNGENWISINIMACSDTMMMNCDWITGSFGVKTDAGQAFVPPVDLVSVVTSEGAATNTGDWGMGSDWNATDVTVATNELTVTVVLNDAGLSPRYNGGSQGVWNEGVLTPTANLNEYTLTITLYEGWNWIGIDDDNNHWYNLNVYTENGAVLPRPEISAVNGVAVTPDSSGNIPPVQTTGCTATIEGVVPANTTRLWVDWSGSADGNAYWENQEILLAGGGAATDTVTFSATVPLVSGTNAHNSVNFWDDTNLSSAWFELSTSSTCSYSEPVLDLGGVETVSGAALPFEFETYNAGSETQVVVFGTTNIPGRVVKVAQSSCGTRSETSAVSATTANQLGSYDWSATIDIIDGYQWVDLSDGHNWFGFSLQSTNGVVGSPAISLNLPMGVSDLSSPFDCGFAMWDAGMATTLTITGTTTAGAGSGEYFVGSGWGEFVIDQNGSFTFDVTLYNGSNFISINDSAWNHFDLDIQTSNGVMPPRYVMITSHANGSTGVGNDTAATTVSGTVDVANFVVDAVMASVSYQDSATNQSVELRFDSSLIAVNEWGDLPMSYDPQTGAFSLDANIPAGAQELFIRVEGCNTDTCHGHEVWLNSPGASDGDGYFWKPGVSSGTQADNKSATQRNRARQAIRLMRTR